MAENTGLSWTASADKSWININPTAGTGSQNVAITVTPSTTYDDTDTAGTVTFTCTCENCIPCIPRERKVQVTRCAPSCPCSALTLSTNSVQMMVDETRQVTIQSVECIKNISVTSSDTSKVEAAYSNNTITIHGVGEITNAEITVSYNAGEKSCSQHISATVNPIPIVCDCNNSGINLNKNVLTWDYNGINQQTITISKYGEDTCIDSVIVTGAESSEEHFTVNFDQNNISVKPNGKNESADAINATLSVYFEVDGSPCNKKTVNLTHNSQNCSITLSPSTSELNCIGGTVEFTVQ